MKNFATMFMLATGLVMLSGVALFAGRGVFFDSDGSPGSLKDVPVPEPVNLGLFLKSAPGFNDAGFPNVDPVAKAAAIKLGKALFWDMNIGSDGQACASCHFSAGADNRTSNQMSPGLFADDNTFQVSGPNEPVAAIDFPFNQRQPADRQESSVVRDINDVMSSMGVFNTRFQDIVIGSPFDLGTPEPDPIFNVSGNNTRRVEPRNAPTVINAVFNFSNFWDGRARNIFNGVNPLGELDQQSGIFVQEGGVISPVPEIIRIPDASLASQAVGPPLSDLEMSFEGRTFAKIGKKVLSPALKPLSRQKIDPTDSQLGDLADSPTGLKEIAPEENAYVSLIKQAFQDRYWNSPGQHITFNITAAYWHEPDRDDPRSYYWANGIPTIVNAPADPNDTGQFTQMEADFSLFFGLAVQLYEATLVSDDSKFDRVREARARLSREEKDGENIFFGAGRCDKCHGGPEFTNHSVSQIRGGALPQPPGFLAGNAIERMNMADGKAFYDRGIYNISVTRTGDDRSRGGDSPFTNPLTGEPFPLSFSRLGLLKRAGLLPADVAQFIPDLPGDPGISRAAVDGAFKTPSLRNLELTGPYLHNGGASILQHVIEFYTRGGNFPSANVNDLDQDIGEIGKLINKPERRSNLVRFLLTLTDDRVRFEKAPFDHPQLFVPAGDGLQNSQGNPFLDSESFIEIPAVGAGGRVEPLKPFLNLDPVSGQSIP
ncbi:MAG: cytochrome C peroxidase [Chloroflexi bacterium]|nr:cytochrome C peroxidase [Chloroflexota bacterium]